MYVGTREEDGISAEFIAGTARLASELAPVTPFPNHGEFYDNAF